MKKDRKEYMVMTLTIVVKVLSHFTALVIGFVLSGFGRRRMVPRSLENIVGSCERFYVILTKFILEAIHYIKTIGFLNLIEAIKEIRELKRQAFQVGEKTFEYVKGKLPEEIRANCEAGRDSGIDNGEYLDICLKENRISLGEGLILAWGYAGIESEKPKVGSVIKVRYIGDDHGYLKNECIYEAKVLKNAQAELIDDVGKTIIYPLWKLEVLKEETSYCRKCGEAFVSVDGVCPKCGQAISGIDKEDVEEARQAVSNGMWME